MLRYWINNNSVLSNTSNKVYQLNIYLIFLNIELVTCLQWYLYSQWMLSFTGKMFVKIYPSFGINSVQNMILQLSLISAKNLPVCARTTSLLFFLFASTNHGSMIIVREYVNERNGLGGIDKIGRWKANY